MKRSGLAAWVLLMLLCTSIFSCKSQKYVGFHVNTTNKKVHKIPFIPSPNFSERKLAPFVILHHTAGDNFEDALKILTDPKRGVSAHYLIGQDGRMAQLVDEQKRAWHGGKSSWYSLLDLNSVTIGIELVNKGLDSFATAQIDTLLPLLDSLKARYCIPERNFIGHADIAPDRKSDPSRYFPWERLAKHGFGIWADSATIAQIGVLPDFDPRWALSILGYNVSNLPQAIKAFKLHYVPKDPTAILTEPAKRMLYALTQKILAMPIRKCGDSTLKNRVPWLQDSLKASPKNPIYGF